jgi:hypothetical protein
MVTIVVHATCREAGDRALGIDAIQPGCWEINAAGCSGWSGYLSGGRNECISGHHYQLYTIKPAACLAGD